MENTCLACGSGLENAVCVKCGKPCPIQAVRSGNKAYILDIGKGALNPVWVPNLAYAGQINQKGYVNILVPGDLVSLTSGHVRVHRAKETR